ncbi:MAG TPA: ribonuclease H-like domain-containing protein [Nitrolancea sp.]
MRSFRERYAALNPENRTPVAKPVRGVPIEAIESGTFRHNLAGDVFVCETRHVDARLNSLRERGAVASRLHFTQSLNGGIGPTDLLFLDTETTGLAGGTGTNAFLIGVGYFDGGTFTLQQFFMRSPAEERSMLEELRFLFSSFPVLVTFNGKSFDWPLLDTRYLMHGYRLDFNFTHLDLLHPARRIWKHRLPSCSLTSLEQEIYGIERVGDVPGYLIPQLYFDYLRDGDARRLRSVFSHNRADIVTLARLLETLLQVETEPDTALTHVEDRIGLALAFLAAGEFERARQMLTDALPADGLNPALRRRAQKELWLLLRRSGCAHEGLTLLESMCVETIASLQIDLFPYLELAKYFEHVARDYRAAERIVERALRALDLAGRRTERSDLIYRLNRIQRKQRTIF